MGIVPNHIDNHMGSLYGLATGNNFFDSIFKISAEYGLPFRLPRNLSERYLQGLPEKNIKEITGRVNQLVQMGFVLPDYLVTVKHGKTFKESMDAYKKLLEGLKPGVTELYIHAAFPTDEMKAVSNAWKNRDFDYRAFSSPEMKKMLDDLGIKLIGWKPLQDLQIKQMSK